MSIDRHTPRKYNKQVLPVEMLQRFLVEAIGDDLTEAVSAFYDRGVSFGNAITIAAAGNDAFSLQCGGTGKTIMALDGIGGVMRVKHGDPRLTGVHFENTIGTPYFVGLERASYPAAPSDSHPLDINTVTLKPEYRLYQDTFGRVGHPGSVTVNGNGTITLGLDSLLLDPGADHAGRKVKVWLKEPISSDPEIAIQELTSTFSSGTNKVTTPNTAVVKTLGQETPSTDVTDYFVLVEGPTVTQNLDLFNGETVELNGTVEFQKDSLTGTVFLKGTDTAFTSQLSAGSKIKIYGESRTVLKVNSDTEAIVDRGSDAEPEGVKATICGIQYIGTIEGGGPTAAYDSASTAQQRVVQFTLADLTRAFRRDSHGFVKVDVLADPSDSNEAQIRVRNSAGSVVFSVNEAGKIVGDIFRSRLLDFDWFKSIVDGDALTANPDDGISQWVLLGETSYSNSGRKVRLYHNSSEYPDSLIVTINATPTTIFEGSGPPDYLTITSWQKDSAAYKSVMLILSSANGMSIKTRSAVAGTWTEWSDGDIYGIDTISASTANLIDANALRFREEWSHFHEDFFGDTPLTDLTSALPVLPNGIWSGNGVSGGAFTSRIGFSGAGGKAIVLTGNTTNDYAFLNTETLGSLWDPAKGLIFESLLSVSWSGSPNQLVRVGLGTNMAAGTGTFLWFDSSVDNEWHLHVKGVDYTTGVSVVSGNYIKARIEMNSTTVVLYLNGVSVATVTPAGGMAAAQGGGIGLYIKTREAVSKTLEVDYVSVWQGR